MASERRRAELGARGRARMLERFTHERIAEATVEVYREMMAGPQPNPLRRARAET
jgi:hypothetical protein